MSGHRSARLWSRFVKVGALLAPLTVATFLAFPGVASAQPQQAFQGHVTSNSYDPGAGSAAKPSNSGATVDPLKYDCTYPASPGNCQHIGLTHGYYDGSTVNFLYTANFYCDPGVSSKATTGCEAGAKYSKLPPDAAAQDPVYIVVPLGFKAPNLQCPMTGNCIDHPATMDLTRLASTLDPILHTTPAQLADAPASPHTHILNDRNNNLPEWWNVVVVGATSQAAYDKATATKSYAGLKSMEGKNGLTAEVPTNIFLYFQTLAGTNGDALNAYDGGSGPGMAPTSTGAAIDPLAGDCTSQAACSAAGIGLTQGYLGSATGNVFYTENYFCDKSVSARSSTGCEAGSSYSKLPPGTSSASQTDPLFIITPLFKPELANLQCPNSGYCIDHPGSVDLTRLASTLDPLLGTTPGQLADVPLSPHSHIVLTANNNEPEWWNVHVLGVTNQAAYDKIMTASNKYAEVQALQQDPTSGVTQPIPTNIFLWFQVLPGAVPGAPGTGGGSTAGLQHRGMLVGGGATLVAGVLLGAAVLTRRRREDELA